MADNWWDGLVAPAGGGKGNLSGAESKELSEARENNEQGRNIFPALANTYRVAQRYPGGNPNAVLAKGMLGIGSNEPQYQDYSLLKKFALKAAISKAKLLGRNPTDKDLAVSYEVGATPEDRFGNNKAIIGQDFSEASRTYFQNAFKQRWAANNGGLNGKDKQGRSYAEALAQRLKDPALQQLFLPPWQRAQSAAQPHGGGNVIHYDAEGNRIP